MDKEKKSEIVSYFHCKQCLSKYLETFGNYEQKIEAGFTKYGVQAWCKNCNQNIIHIDFQGQKHPLR